MNVFGFLSETWLALIGLSSALFLVVFAWRIEFRRAFYQASHSTQAIEPLTEKEYLAMERASREHTESLPALIDMLNKRMGATLPGEKDSGTVDRKTA